MENLLDKLHLDHVNFIKLLTFIECQLDHIQNCEIVDFETILFSMKYMKDYPDAIHHPLENIVFNYFLNQYDQLRDEIAELLHEHENMPLLTDKVVDMLQCVITEEPISRHLLCENLARYLDVQKAHMNREECEIYPVIYKIMKDSDWKALDETLTVSNDPLFDVPRNESYQLLFKTITSSM